MDRILLGSLTIDSVEFVLSAAAASDLPADGAPELALTGRSNVGKSSLINALVRRPIARTSGTPGKTRLINVYRVRPARMAPFYLVDLPGYGYTDAREGREAFAAVTRTYFLGRVGQVEREGRVGQEGRHVRPAIAGLVLVVDARHPGLASDLAAREWAASLGIPALPVATKIDKLSRADRARALAALERIYQGPVPPVSAATGEGLDEVWRQMLRCVNLRRPR